MILNLSMSLLFFHTTRNKCKKKTSLIETTAATLGLNVNKGKTKIMKNNSKTKIMKNNSKTKIMKNNSPIKQQGEVADEVQSFMYLGSIMDTNRGTDSEVRARIGKARAASTVFNKTWNSREISIPTELLILTKILRLCLCMDQRRHMAYYKIHATDDPNLCK